MKEQNGGILIKSAMTYGLAMGIFWAIKYLFLIFGYTYAFSMNIYLLLSLAVPFVAYYMTRRYRNDIGGYISFFHAWRFGILLYLFAAIIVSVEHFIFYKFIAPPDFIENTMHQAVSYLESLDAHSDIVESIAKINFTPIHMTIQGIFNNIFYGIILSVPVAAFVCRKKAPETAA